MWHGPDSDARFSRSIRLCIIELGDIRIESESESRVSGSGIRPLWHAACAAGRIPGDPVHGGLYARITLPAGARALQDRIMMCNMMDAQNQDCGVKEGTTRARP